MMKQLIRKIVGTTDECSFEEMLYHGICFFGFIAGLMLTIVSFISQTYIGVMISLLITAFLGIMYYFARFKRRYFFFGLYSCSTLIAMAGYFLSAGIHGPTPYFFLIILVLALAYNPVKLHARIFAFHVTLICVIFLIEYGFPQLVINPCKTPQILHNMVVMGMIVSLFLIFMSIYFLRKSYDEERKKNQQQKALLEKASYQKSMFFINLSHEIKTPLTLVENYLAQYIERKGEDDELVVMQQNVRKMRKDILDYLNFENLERGRVSYDKTEPLLLSKFLETKAELFLPYAENKNIALQFNIEPDVIVKVNLQGIDQVLNNLLENAVKYTPASGTINMKLEGDTLNARLTIQNSGTEIPASQLPHLFEPFYQMSHEKLNAQGIGMGLYIVKKILDCMGGQIHVLSNKEQGVVFSVLLPLGAGSVLNIEPVIMQPIHGISVQTSKAVDSTYMTNRPNLLLVEDNNELLKYMAEQLGGSYNIYVAEHGAIAVAKLENIAVPDLIISDIMMDTMDGYQLLEATLNDERYSHIPFVFITAKDKPEEKVESLALGALDFITKPFLMPELKVKIKTIIEQKKRISDAVIRDMKKQFAGDYFVSLKQKQNEVFNANTLNYGLSSREKEVAMCIKEGLDYEKIAEQLHISRHTVNRHVQNIYEKTGANSKISLVDKLFF
jgi:signal transduction histidine kinase/DNA-binding NarL/FixJ family response regulator